MNPLAWALALVREKWEWFVQATSKEVVRYDEDRVNPFHPGTAYLILEEGDDGFWWVVRVIRFGEKPPEAEEGRRIIPIGDVRRIHLEPCLPVLWYREGQLPTHYPFVCVTKDEGRGGFVFVVAMTSHGLNPRDDDAIIHTSDIGRLFMPQVIPPSVEDDSLRPFGMSVP